MPSSSRAARVASCKWPPPLASSRSPSTTSCASIQRPAAISEAARDSNSPSGRGGAAPSVCSASSATRVASGCPISGRRAAARGGEDTPPPPRRASRSDPPPPASACLSLARSASSRPSASSAAGSEMPGILGETLRRTSPPSERHLGPEARRSGTRAGGQPTSPAAGPANQPTSSIKTARRDPANRSGWQILAGWPHAGRPASTRRKCAARQAAPTCPRPSCTPNGPASSSGPPPIRRARTPSSAPAPRIPAC
mmetsp:Transcript_34031/g.109304  ORF Transcript_34031/g.109304 Transcript_34031/m.109304 type:complete len:254 (-) Transcript_34031:95-856(-)